MEEIPMGKPAKDVTAEKMYFGYWLEKPPGRGQKRFSVLAFVAGDGQKVMPFFTTAQKAQAFAARQDPAAKMRVCTVETLREGAKFLELCLSMGITHMTMDPDPLDQYGGFGIATPIAEVLKDELFREEPPEARPASPVG